MLPGNGSGYVEAEAYGSAEARFFKKLGSGYVLETVLEARFRKLPQGSDSDSDSEAGSVRPMKLPCNVGENNLIMHVFHLYGSITLL
ncbi:unnamed protein product [Brassica rapa]|uniref:Uncharacterized protein n=1 Tax=Brassica campestris TaxID=3711 RepID=A0A8D9DPT6_BRACM|nr:unnamed protein product [Brassica rapa]